MRIVSTILTRIDKELSSEGLKFSRYIDDYIDDYEVYIFEENEKSILSIFTRVLKRYGFSLNNEKTEIIEFPYYVSENLEKIFANYSGKELETADLIELFNLYGAFSHLLYCSCNFETAAEAAWRRILYHTNSSKP